MSILVIAALAVMVLLLVGVFFTGGFRAVGSNMVDFVRGSTGGAGGAADEAVCNSWCTKDMLMDEGSHYPLPTQDTSKGGDFCDKDQDVGCPGENDVDCRTFC